jgi:hypothetical protein
MSVLNSTSPANGEIELTNGWKIQLGTDADSPAPNTIIGIIDPNGNRYDTSNVLMNTESPDTVVQEFEKSVERLSDLSELDRLENHDSQVVREMVRILPDFDAQGNPI